MLKKEKDIFSVIYKHLVSYTFNTHKLFQLNIFETNVCNGYYTH